MPTDSGNARWIELVTAILLSVAGLATGWATYQAALWGGTQANHYAEAGAQLTDATRLELKVGQVSAVDYLMFQGWLDAAAKNEAGLMTFYERRFRPEFAAAFAKWRAKYPGDIRTYRPAAGAELPPQPRFAYAEQTEASRLRKEAEASYAAGDKANAISDRFVAITVLLSTVLFLAGIASVLRRHAMRAVVLALASLLCAAALVYMVTLPSQSL